MIHHTRFCYYYTFDSMYHGRYKRSENLTLPHTHIQPDYPHSVKDSNIRSVAAGLTHLKLVRACPCERCRGLMRKQPISAGSE
jgi:hypothetical protein